MKRFKSPEHAQRFLEVHDIVAAHFRPKRHLLSASDYQAERQSQLKHGSKSSPPDFDVDSDSLLVVAVSLTLEPHDLPPTAT